MKLVYYCNECNTLIEKLEVKEIDEEKLGLTVLTLDEKEDIINKIENGMEIGIICDECEAREDFTSLVNNNLVH